MSLLTANELEWMNSSDIQIRLIKAGMDINSVAILTDIFNGSKEKNTLWIKMQ